MANDPQYDELQRQIAALTARVYELEHRDGWGDGAKPISSIEPVKKPEQPAKAPFPKPKSQWKPGDKIESEIGGHWLNRVGIIAVLIGVAYFLKYAFDNEWVGPAGRVVIGLVAGTSVVAGSERVRRSGYAIFSYSLKAVGIGVLYLSLWASSQVYHLVPNSQAFAAMISVTAATVALALWQDAEVIAAFSAVGAFITPLALSTGENNAFSLFLYITILDIGALVLLRYRSWVAILMGSYIGSLILYGTWHSRFYSGDQFLIAIGSASAVFVVFALAPFIDKRDEDSTAVILVTLANAAAYFFEVWELFQHQAKTRESAATAIALGCLYFMGAFALERRRPSVIAQVHAAIGAALFVIAVPVGLDAQWLTPGWLIEAAALIQVSKATRNKTIRLLACLALVLGLCRLLVVDQFNVTVPVFNERMAMYAIAVGVIGFVSSRWVEALPTLMVTMNIVALIGLNQEVTGAFQGIVRDFAYSALWMSYGAGLMFVGFWKKSRFLRWQALILIGITICKVFLYDTSSLDRIYRILSFIALGLVLLVTSFLYQRDFFKLEER